MPKETDDEAKIDELLAELKNETSEVSNLPQGPKKDIKNPYKDKKNDDYNTYEFSDDRDLSDEDW